LDQLLDGDCFFKGRQFDHFSNLLQRYGLKPLQNRVFQQFGRLKRKNA